VRETHRDDRGEIPEREGTDAAVPGGSPTRLIGRTQECGGDTVGHRPRSIVPSLIYKRYCINERKPDCKPADREGAIMTTMPHTATAANETESVVAAVLRHHAQLARGVADRVNAVLDAVDMLSPGVEDARTELARYCEEELLPHAAAEEHSLYRVGAELAASELLVAAMTAEHVSLRALVDEIANASSSARLAAAAGGLRSLFDAHLAKENDRLLRLWSPPE
jgi:hemerythrin-like domain-containing protein